VGFPERAKPDPTHAQKGDHDDQAESPKQVTLELALALAPTLTLALTLTLTLALTLTLTLALTLALTLTASTGSRGTSAHTAS